MAMHSGEIAIPDEVVRDLVGAQFPQWRKLPVRRLATTGTVNAIFRVGDGLAARLPLREGDPGEVAASLRQEAAAAAALAEQSPFPVPRPVAIGMPGPGYPLPWSVQTWLPGSVATDADPGGSVAFAEDLATLITAMRQGTEGRRFSGEGRGGHLPAHDAWMEECFRESEGLLDVTRARALWARLRELPDPGRAGDGPALVLRRQQSADERARAADARAHLRGQRRLARHQAVTGIGWQEPG